MNSSLLIDNNLINGLGADIDFYFDQLLQAACIQNASASVVNTDQATGTFLDKRKA